MEAAGGSRGQPRLSFRLNRGISDRRGACLETLAGRSASVVRMSLKKEVSLNCPPIAPGALD